MVHQLNGSLFGVNDELAYAADFLDLRRPPCPKCKVRMIARQPGGATFECLHCGHVQTLAAPKRPALG
jgi:hypothetical protein